MLETLFPVISWIVQFSRASLYQVADYSDPLRTLGCRYICQLGLFWIFLRIVVPLPSLCLFSNLDGPSSLSLFLLTGSRCATADFHLAERDRN